MWRTAGSFETVILTLFGAGVTGEHASFLEDGTIFVGLEKGAGDAEADRFGLAGEAAAFDVGLHIITLFAAHEDEGLLEVEEKGLEGEIVLHIASVDRDFAFAGGDVDAGDGGFPPAGAVILGSFSHGLFSLFAEVENDGVLGDLFVLGAFVDVELLDHDTAEATLGDHAPNGTLEHLDRVFLEHDAGGTGAEATVVTGDVVIVLLGLRVVAGELDLLRVDDDDVVAAIDVRSVGGLVLAHEDDRDFRSEAAKGDIGGIDEVPVADNGFLLSQRGLTLHGCFFLSVDFLLEAPRQIIGKTFYEVKRKQTKRVFVKATLFYNHCVKKKNDELLLDLADENDGYVSVATARENGIAQTYLSFMCAQGIFTKVGKGLYRKRGYEADPFFELRFRYGKAVFSLDSCLYLHGLSDTPTLSVNLPANYLTHGIEGASCRHVGEKEYLTGQSLVVTPKGNLVMAYDLERTLIELIRQQDRFGKEEFLSLWEKGKKKSPYPSKLAHYAQAFRVEGELSLLLKLL